MYNDDIDNYPYDDVLQFDVTSLSWTNISTLQQARAYHAMSVVIMEDVIDQCVNVTTFH